MSTIVHMEAPMRVRTSDSLAHLVREFRLERGMTQDELAQAIGASRRWVVKFEAGLSTAQLDLALRAAEAVGLEIDASPSTASAEADAVFRSVFGG